MSNPLVSKRRGLLRFPFFRLPTTWEDLEDEMSAYGMEPSGVSLSEDANHVYVEAQMPGLRLDDINVTLENGILRIMGEREEVEDQKEKKFHRRASYAFNYRLSLPGQIDEATPKATYKDGVMKIVFKKTKEGKAKKITVKGG